MEILIYVGTAIGQVNYEHTCWHRPVISPFCLAAFTPSSLYVLNCRLVYIGAMAGEPREKVEVSDSDPGPETKEITTQDTADPGRTSKEASEGDKYGSTDDHVFSDPSVAEYWRAKYEKASYENRHRFDPEYKWTAEEERRLVRKVDARIMVWAWLMFCALDMHRRNINRAISDNMLAEIGKSSSVCYTYILLMYKRIVHGHQNCFRD